MQVHQIYEPLTLPRIRVMGLLVDGRTIAQVADEMGITYEGAKSHVRDIKVITGCESVDEIRAWWGQHMRPWLRWVAHNAGLDVGT